MKGGVIRNKIGAQRYNQALVALRRYLEWRNRTDLRAHPLNLWAMFEDHTKKPVRGERRNFDPIEVWGRIKRLDTDEVSTEGFCVGLRDAAFLALLLATGARPGHASLLKVGDIDLRNKIVYLPAFKQTPLYDIPIQPDVIPLLKRWRESKAREASPRYKGSEYFFHGSRGARLRRNDWVEIVRRHNLRAGWKSNTRVQFSLNCLRPTYGSWALNKGRATIGEVQVLLGHASSETTSKWYARYDIRSIKRVIAHMQLEKRPRAKTRRPR